MKDHSELLTKGATSTRRGFIKRASAAAAGLGAWQALSAERVAGANERVNVAIIGCGGRGRFILRVMIEDAGAHCVAISDLSDERMDQMWTFIQPVQTEKPRFEKDYRKILEAKDIDAVIVATHDNWHAPLTIQACQAGKDVYVEKPHSFCMWESGKMVEAAAKYRRVVQVGTQNRSTEYNLRRARLCRAGSLARSVWSRSSTSRAARPSNWATPASNRQASTGTAGWDAPPCGPITSASGVAAAGIFTGTTAAAT